jgi:hypothetical protein
MAMASRPRCFARASTRSHFRFRCAVDLISSVASHCSRNLRYFLLQDRDLWQIRTLYTSWPNISDPPSKINPLKLVSLDNSSPAVFSLCLSINH